MDIEWAKVERVLVVKLRSIGDTVLATPSLRALRRFLPHARIDILLEDWVAPVLQGTEDVDRVLTVGKTVGDRLKMARELRRQRYDVAFNLHGGTTATFLVRASGARHRVGSSNYQYSFLYNHLLSSSAEFWGRQKTHSAEQQLAVLGSVGVPVDDAPRTHLTVTEAAASAVEKRLVQTSRDLSTARLAIIHPGTAFFTKQWPVENFARTVEYLHSLGIASVAVGSRAEGPILSKLSQTSNVPILFFDDLSLPEITALAARSQIFIGNDSGIAHIAAAVGAPTVVIFGSSNRDHWRPWTDAPNEVIYEPFECQPCPGYKCEAYGDARCIRTVPVASVTAAIDRLLS